MSQVKVGKISNSLVISDASTIMSLFNTQLRSNGPEGCSPILDYSMLEIQIINVTIVWYCIRN